MTPLRADALKSDALLLLAAAIWGFAFVAQRAGMEYVGPFTFNAVRFALGALALVPFILARRTSPASVRGRRREAGGRLSVVFGGGLAGLVLFAGASLQQVGIVYTTAGKAGFITGLYVILVPILGLALGHRPGLWTWAGAALATTGLYLLSATEGIALAPGDSFVLLGAFFWAAHVLIIGRFSPRVDVLRLALVQYLVCSALSLAVAGSVEVTTVAGLRGAAVPILYGGVLSVGVAFTLQVAAQRRAPPAHAAILLSLETVFAVLGGWLILGEVLGPRALTGCALMLAGILWSQSGRKPEIDREGL